MLAQCGSLTSAGIATLADNCGQLKMIDVAFTKVMFQFLMKNSQDKNVGSRFQTIYVFVQLQNNNTVIKNAYILKLSRMDTHKQIKVAIKFYPIKIFFWGAFCFDFSLDFGLQCTFLVSPVYRDRLR